MSSSSSAREALIVEALGEVAILLDRVESIATSMETNRLALVNANAQLAERLMAFDAGMTSIAQQTKARAVEHIVRRANEATSASIATQARAMAEAARLAFSTQVDTSLSRLTASLLQVIHRVDRPWDLWLTHAATAAVSVALTCGVVFALACR